jgi:galactokinase
MRWFVPGRIEVLGKHTDYAGGRSLLCCVERGIHLVARPRPDGLVRIADATRGLEAVLRFGDDRPASGWVAYAATILRRLSRNFPGPLSGADIAFASNLPRASGLSSSSALVVALFSALSEVNRLAGRTEYRESIRSQEDLAGYLGCVENGYPFGCLEGEQGVGTFGGSEDHTAILCGREGRLSRYSFCPVRAEGTVELPVGWVFAVAVSGVASDKTGSARDKYNRASLCARAVLDLWNGTTGRSDPTLAFAAAESPDAPDRIRDVLRYGKHPDFRKEALLARFDQFVEESDRLVPAAAEAFARRDAAELSRAVDRSQDLAERLLGNQIPETVALGRQARNLGAIAASAFGGGFGGSVWALVPAARADEFLETWRADYRGRYPVAAGASEFFRTGAGPAMSRL